MAGLLLPAQAVQEAGLFSLNIEFGNLGHGLVIHLFGEVTAELVHVAEGNVDRVPVVLLAESVRKNPEPELDHAVGDFVEFIHAQRLWDRVSLDCGSHLSFQVH